MRQSLRVAPAQALEMVNILVIDDQPEKLLSYEVALAQVDIGFHFRESHRGHTAMPLLDPGLFDEGALAPSFPISGTFAKADLELHPVRFLLNPELLPSEGGVRKL